EASGTASTGLEVMAVIAAVQTFGYMGRFWQGRCAGKALGNVQLRPDGLLAARVALATRALAPGFSAAAGGRRAHAASTDTLRTPVEMQVRYVMNQEAMMAFIVFVAGTLMIVTRQYWRQIPATIAIVGSVLGPDRLFSMSIFGLNRLSDRIHWIEVR